MMMTTTTTNNNNNMKGQAFAPVMALNNKGVDLYTQNGDYDSARKYFRAAIDLLEKVLKSSENSRRRKHKASLAAASESNRQKMTKRGLSNQNDMKSRLVSDNRASVETATEQVASPEPTNGPGNTSIVTLPPAQHSTNQATTTVPPNPRHNSHLYVSTRPVKLAASSFGLSKNNIRSSVATTVVSFNLALSYHMLSLRCTLRDKTIRLQRSAVAFYEVALMLRSKSAKRHGNRRFGGPMIVLLDLAIFNNIAILYQQNGEMERAEGCFHKLRLQIRCLDASVARQAGGFIRNLVAIGSENVSPPAAAA